MNSHEPSQIFIATYISSRYHLEEHHIFAAFFFTLASRVLLIFFSAPPAARSVTLQLLRTAFFGGDSSSLKGVSRMVCSSDSLCLALGRKGFPGASACKFVYLVNEFFEAALLSFVVTSSTVRPARLVLRPPACAGVFALLLSVSLISCETFSRSLRRIAVPREPFIMFLQHSSTIVCSCMLTFSFPRLVLPTVFLPLHVRFMDDFAVLTKTSVITVVIPSIEFFLGARTGRLLTSDLFDTFAATLREIARCAQCWILSACYRIRISKVHC